MYKFNNMEINYIAIGVCAVLAMVVGYVWYGLLFKNAWLRIIGADQDTLEQREAMQKEAGPLYVIQFVLVLGQLYILSHFIKGWEEAGGIEAALWIWLGFIMPTLAGCAMWTNEPNKQKWARFLIQAGYQLVLFVTFGYILGTW